MMVRPKFLGANTVHLCELCRWPFRTFYEMLAFGLDSQQRRAVYVLLYSVEHPDSAAPGWQTNWPESSAFR